MSLDQGYTTAGPPGQGQQQVQRVDVIGELAEDGPLRTFCAGDSSAPASNVPGRMPDRSTLSAAETAVFARLTATATQARRAESPRRPATVASGGLPACRFRRVPVAGSCLRHVTRVNLFMR